MQLTLNEVDVGTDLLQLNAAGAEKT